MIVSEDHVVSYIKNWLFSVKNYHNKAGFVLPMTGGIDSWLCSALCLSVRPSCPVYIIKMGFKKELEDSFETWSKAFNNVKFIEPKHPEISISKIDSKNALISTYVSLLSEEYNLLSVGKSVKSEFSFIKEVGLDFYDCYPIFDLYKSEVISLGKYFSFPEELLGSTSLVEQKMGISYHELEWLDRENEKVNIINSDSVPSVSKFWGLYSQRQKEIIGKVYSLSRQRKHIDISEKKVCKLRKQMPGLFS